MNGHNPPSGRLASPSVIFKELLFYLGIMLIFFPFLRQSVLYIPVTFIVAWLLKFASRWASESSRFERTREDIDRFFAARRAYLAAAIVAVAATVPFWSSGYLLDVMTTALIYAILAVALNVTVGYSGVLVLGFIGFYAIGAYTVGILTAKFPLIGFWIAFPTAGIIAMLFGLLLGIPTLRLKGDYLAIVTLGFGEIVKIFLNNLDSITGGPNGILGVPRPSIFGYTLASPRDFYLLCLVMLLLIAGGTARLGSSRYGRAWIAIRENEMAAQALGINVFKKNLLSFSISSFLGGLAGALFAAKQGFISPDSFTFYESVLVLCMVVLGGLGNVTGAILGAFLLIVVPESFREFQLYRMLLFGAAMVIVMIFRPHGLLGSRILSLEMEDRQDAAAD